MRILILIALLVAIPLLAQAASRHHHDRQYVQEHRDAYVMGYIKPLSTDRESYVMVPGN